MIYEADKLSGMPLKRIIAFKDLYLNTVHSMLNRVMVCNSEHLLTDIINTRVLDTRYNNISVISYKLGFDTIVQRILIRIITPFIRGK